MSSNTNPLADYVTEGHSTATSTSTGDAFRPPMAERQHRLTPLDVRQATFASATLGGFNKAEVRDFLMEAAEGYDAAARENERLRQEIARLEVALKQYRNLEHSMNSALVNAQRVADDVGTHAADEAARIVKEAEGRAEMLLLAGQGKIADTQREVDTLRLKRREAEASLELLISSLSSTLDFARGPQRDARVVPQRTPIQAVG